MNKLITFDLELNDKSIQEDETGLYIEGYATVFGNVDRDGEVHQKDIQALTKAMDAYMATNPIVLIEHGRHPAIGKTPFGHLTSYVIDHIGIKVKAYIEKPVWQPVLEYYNKIKAGTVRTFSISAMFEKFANGVIKARDIIETTVTSVPANPLAVFGMVDKAFENFDETGHGTIDASNSTVTVGTATVTHGTSGEVKEKAGAEFSASNMNKLEAIIDRLSGAMDGAREMIDKIKNKKKNGESNE